MYPNIEDVNSIIERMDNLTSEEKIHLSAIFDKMLNRQEDLFNSLKDNVKKELETKQVEEVDIYTALVGAEMKKEMKNYNFFDICPNTKVLEAGQIEIKNEEISSSVGYECGIVFWADDFWDLSKLIINRKYSAKIYLNGVEYKTDYFFKYYYAFVDKERELHALAAQYQFENPLIYNPMARRALSVVLRLPFDISKRDTVVADLCLKDNELEDKIILNNYLLWNISEKGYDELPPAATGDYREVVPLWDKSFLVYRFPAKNKNPNIKEFILVENDIRVIKRVGNDIYWQVKDECCEMSFKKFQICSLDESVKRYISSKTKYLFHNDYSQPCFGSIERIRTKADVIREISCFGSFNVTVSDVCTSAASKDMNIIYTYPKRLDYYQIKDDRLRTSAVCRILFCDNGQDKMFADKVSYILAYMNYRYPEYRWVGGI